MQEFMKGLGIFIAIVAFILITGCALAPLVEEIHKAKVKRASERYAKRHGTAV